MTHKKQFGIWMDTHHATVVGRQDVDSGDFVVINHVENKGAARNSSENAANNHEQAMTLKYFKEIANNMTNAEVVHITGTGQIQEQFMKYLAETPQFKNVEASDSTENKMSDDKLVEFVSNMFH